MTQNEMKGVDVNRAIVDDTKAVRTPARQSARAGLRMLSMVRALNAVDDVAPLDRVMYSPPKPVRSVEEHERRIMEAEAKRARKAARRSGLPS